jgi:hypothetical protein
VFAEARGGNWVGNPGSRPATYHLRPWDYWTRRVSTVAVQRFCKPKVGGSNPSPGTNVPISYLN